MTPDDPRHGTEAGNREHYRHNQSPCLSCLDAHRRRNIMRALYPAKRPSIGPQRRIQALQAIGYGRDRIAHALGYTDGGALAYLMRSDTMLVSTAERIAEVYDRMSMTVPEGVGAARARTWARRHGWPPPLAWDDIDNPDETPSYPQALWSAHFPGTDEEADPVVVTRILNGDYRLAANLAERREVTAQWPGSLNQLGQLTGWRPSRYYKKEADA